MILLNIDYVHYAYLHPFNTQFNLNVLSNTVALVGQNSADGSVTLLGSFLLPEDNSSSDFSINVTDFEQTGNTLTVSSSSGSISSSSTNGVNSPLLIGDNLARLLSGNTDFDSLFSSSTISEGK